MTLHSQFIYSVQYLWLCYDLLRPPAILFADFQEQIFWLRQTWILTRAAVVGLGLKCSCILIKLIYTGPLTRIMSGGTRRALEKKVFTTFWPAF